MTKTLNIHYGNDTVTLSGECEYAYSPDDLVHDEYDEGIDRPVHGARRSWSRPMLVLHTAPMSVTDILALQPMIHSPFVTFLLDGSTLTAIPYCDDLDAGLASNEAAPLTIRFQYAERNGFFSPGNFVAGGDGIFTEQFTPQFV